MKTVLKYVTISTGFFMGLCLSTKAIENEVWISPIGPAASIETNSYPAGLIGTPTYPFRCPDPGSLNWVLTHDLTVPNVTIHFMAGTFKLPANVINGQNYSINPLQGWKLRGAGIDNTIMQLQSTNLGNLQTLMICGPLSGVAQGVEVSDMTIDCNLRSGISAGAINAITLLGNDSKISRVKGINWGSLHTGWESFVFVIRPPDCGYATNCVIEDCVVTQPANVTHACGTTAMAVFTDLPYGMSLMYDAILRNNLVYNITAGSSVGMPQYIHAYSGNGTISHNRALNIIDTTGTFSGCAVYRDTWAGRDCIIENNVFENVSEGVYFNLPNLGFTNLVVRNNSITIAEGGYGVACYNPDTNSKLTNLILKENIITPAPNAINVTAFYPYVRNLTANVTGNIFQGGGTGFDLSIYWQLVVPEWDNPGSGIHWNTWADNANLSGMQLNYSGGQCLPGDRDSITFTPTAAGWYRIMKASSYVAGTVRLESPQWNNLVEDMEFWFRVNGYGALGSTPGEIVESRRGSYPYPLVGQVTQARIGGDAGGAWTYLDIYIPNVSGAQPVTVTMSGPNRALMLNSPTLNPTTPDNSVTLNL